MSQTSKQLLACLGCLVFGFLCCFFSGSFKKSGDHSLFPGRGFQVVEFERVWNHGNGEFSFLLRNPGSEDGYLIKNYCFDEVDILMTSGTIKVTSAGSIYVHSLDDLLHGQLPANLNALKDVPTGYIPTIFGNVSGPEKKNE